MSTRKSYDLEAIRKYKKIRQEEIKQERKEISQMQSIKNRQLKFVMKKYQNICLYCNKPIIVLCGTPIIYLGGCCYGFKDKKTDYIFPRKAHIECWLRKKKLKITKK